MYQSQIYVVIHGKSCLCGQTCTPHHFGVISFLFLVFFFFPLTLVLLVGSVFKAGLDLVRLAVGLRLLLDTLGLDLECIPWAEVGVLVDGLGTLAKRFGWEYERMPGELEGFLIMGRCTCSLLML